MATDSVFSIQKNQVRATAEMLSRAFYEDPLFTYFFPDPSSRIRKSTGLFQLLIRYGILYGESEVTSPDLEGSAVWYPSDKAHLSIRGMLRSGAISFIFVGGLSTLIRMIRLGNYPVAIHKRHAPFPHWYCQAMGVDPSLQGKRYAGKLLRNKFERYDREGLACYLETQNKENVPFYERFGFEMVEEYRIPKTPFDNWAMLRKPQC